MAFRIDYSPIGALGAAAQAAGQAQAQQAARSRDMAFIRQQAAMDAQLSQAMMARDTRQSELALRERAMALQEAAAARMERTPTARQQGVSPAAAAIQARLGALQQYQASGALVPEEYKEARMRIITGGQAPRPRVPSAAEQRREAQERAEAITTAEQLETALGRTKSAQTKQQLATQLTTLTGRATERWGDEWRETEGARFDFGEMKQPRVGLQVQSLPADRSQLRRGVTYRLHDGRVAAWTGTRFRIIQDRKYG